METGVIIAHRNKKEAEYNNSNKKRNKTASRITRVQAFRSHGTNRKVNDIII